MAGVIIVLVAQRLRIVHTFYQEVESASLLRRITRGRVEQPVAAAHLVRSVRLPIAVDG
jgi:hypothetical protein